jgi:hypothetical protein
MTVDTKGSKSVLARTMENGTQNAMMLSVVVDGRKLTPFVNLKGKNLLKKCHAGIICKFNEKGWMTEELMAEWLREVWHRRPCALLKKRGMLV